MENNSENLDLGAHKTLQFGVSTLIGCVFISEHPLASGFPINAGSVKVTMPKNAATRNDYFVVREYYFHHTLSLRLLNCPSLFSLW